MLNEHAEVVLHKKNCVANPNSPFIIKDSGSQLFMVRGPLQRLFNTSCPLLNCKFSSRQKC